MKFFNRLTTQIFSILAISALISFSSNALRTDGLSLVYANESILQIEEPGGYVSIKEAALLALSNRAIFLDARSKQEFKQGHIQGAFLYLLKILLLSIRILKVNSKNTN